MFPRFFQLIGAVGIFVYFPTLKAQTIECRSCEENFCSRITQVGLIKQDETEERNYNLQVTFFCSGCTGYTIRVAFDDSFKKVYIIEKTGQDGLQSISVSLNNFFISDGDVSLSFELSSTGTSGYTTVDSFSCRVIYDDYPKSPSDVSAIGKDKSFIVQWGKHYDRDITSFLVYVGFPDLCSFYVFETQANMIEISRLGEEPVQNGVKYCGYIVAVDKGGKKSSPSDRFYVVPARTFEFSKYGPEDEKIGCIISHIFGKNSKVTNDLRKIRDLIKRYVPYGQNIVSLYYTFSRFIERFIYFLKDVKFSELIAPVSQAYAQMIYNDNDSEDKSNYLFSLGVGGAHFTKAGSFQGLNTFQLIYGRTTFFGDAEFGKVLIRLIKGNFPVFIIGRANLSYLQGKRLIFDDQGNLKITAESHSNLLFFPLWGGVNLFGEFVDYQIFVPSVEVLLGGVFFFESYTVGKGVFGGVFGGAISLSGNLLLNEFDKRSSAVARAEYGIEKSYLFVKLTNCVANFVRKKDFELKRSKYFDFSSTYISGGILLLF